MQGWKNLVTLRKRGLVRFIGVSNFPDELLKHVFGLAQAAKEKVHLVEVLMITRSCVTIVISIYWSIQFHSLSLICLPVELDGPVRAGQEGAGAREGLRRHLPGLLTVGGSPRHGGRPEPDHQPPGAQGYRREARTVCGAGNYDNLVFVLVRMHRQTCFILHLDYIYMYIPMNT